jgi:ubiquinone/menaquinone biosynthesis C-methylase UbiE
LIEERLQQPKVVSATNTEKGKHMLLIPKKRNLPELLDLPPESYTLDELDGNLTDMALVNTYLGNGRAVLKHLEAMAAGAADEGFTVLDVATGSADIPITIAKWARQAGIRVGITAVDHNELSINIAKKRSELYPEITLVVADAIDLPFANESFDYVLCSKTVHHFTDETAVAMMKEVLRVARRGYIIIDLRRSWIAYFLIIILTRILTRNRLSRNDGPLSVLRSYTLGELATLACRSGASIFSVSREPYLIMALVGQFPSSGSETFRKEAACRYPAIPIVSRPITSTSGVNICSGTFSWMP